MRKNQLPEDFPEDFPEEFEETAEHNTVSEVVPGTIEDEPTGNDIKQLTSNEGHRMEPGSAGSSQNKSSSANNIKEPAPKNMRPRRNAGKSTISVTMDNNPTKKPENAEPSKKRKQDDLESVYEPTLEAEEGAEEANRATKRIQTEANKVGHTNSINKTTDEVSDDGPTPKNGENTASASESTPHKKIPSNRRQMVEPIVIDSTDEGSGLNSPVKKRKEAPSRNVDAGRGGKRMRIASGKTTNAVLPSIEKGGVADKREVRSTGRKISGPISKNKTSSGMAELDENLKKRKKINQSPHDIEHDGGVRKKKARVETEQEVGQQVEQAAGQVVEAGGNQVADGSNTKSKESTTEAHVDAKELDSVQEEEVNNIVPDSQEDEDEVSFVGDKAASQVDTPKKAKMVDQKGKNSGPTPSPLTPTDSLLNQLKHPTPPTESPVAIEKQVKKSGKTCSNCSEDNAKKYKAGKCQPCCESLFSHC